MQLHCFKQTRPYFCFFTFLLILQARDVEAADCFQLVNPKTCTDLAGSWIMPSEKFTDVASFDAYILSSLESSPAYVQQFDQAYGCPNFNGSLRYHASVLCNYLVSFAASECPQSKAAPVMPLCQPTCTNFLMSLNEVFNDPAQCTPVGAATNDQNLKNQLDLRLNELQKGSFSYYCQVLPNSVSPTVCSQGLALDIANCGFVNETFMTAYCATNHDPCCVGATAAMLAQAVSDPNTMYIFVLAGVAGGTLMIVIYLAYSGYELKIRARNTTAVFTNSNKIGRKSVIATTGENPAYLDPKVSPGYNNPVGRKFTVARASYMPSDTAGTLPMSYGSQPRSTRTDQPRFSGNRMEEWRCIETFLPRLRDEMDAQRGDIVIVEEVFDDDWGAGTNARTGQNGCFPMALFERVADNVNRPKKPYTTRQPRQSSLPRGPLNY
ncbi:hypothetical protein SeMB42_g07405 [Synchytrium endobioticum]|uniref:SH3 domain-containing protein n=1 Tax=Synchytrium endobioticum TaxID=286115 RepID=A0A507C7H6_9FUNG|nr:hypothetical protein SeMB42_g07405 [Synchytrium endobioticum]